MIETWVAILSTGVGSFLTGFVSWFFTRKQYEEGVNAQKVQNFDAAIEAYKKMYEDMIDDLKGQIVELKEENATLKEELSENRRQIITLTNFVLANAIQKADGSASEDGINKLKMILE